MSQHTETPVNALVYTVDQSAAILGIGRNAIYEEIAAGRLKSFTHGRRRRIAHDDLVAFVDFLRSESTAKAAGSLIEPSPRPTIAVKAARR